MTKPPLPHLWISLPLAGTLLYCLSTCTADLVLGVDQGTSSCSDGGKPCAPDGQNQSDGAIGEGDLLFKVPYQIPPSPTDQWFRFATVLKKIDLYILEDVSGSMKDELKSIKTNLAAMLESILCDAGELPEIDMCIPSVETGTGEFGRSSEPWRHLKDINANNLAVDIGPDEESTEILLPIDVMGSNEKHLQAISGAINGSCASDPQRAGRACFRTSALGFVVLVSDEDFHEDETFEQRQVLYDQMAAMNLHVIGVTGNDVEASSLQDDLYSMSGGEPQRSLVPVINVIPKTPQCDTLEPNSFFKNRAIVSGPDSAASSALACAVQAITENMPQDLSISIVNTPENRDWRGNPVDVVSAFVDHVEVYQDPTVGCADSLSVGNQGGYPAIFKEVLPGTAVCWKIFVKRNTQVQAAEDQDQHFTATAWIWGAGGVSLDSRTLQFVVPASKNPEID